MDLQYIQLSSVAAVWTCNVSVFHLRATSIELYVHYQKACLFRPLPSAFLSQSI